MADFPATENGTVLEGAAMETRYWCFDSGVDAWNDNLGAQARQVLDGSEKTRTDISAL